MRSRRTPVSLTLHQPLQGVRVSLLSSKNLREFRQYDVAVIRVLDRELGLVRRRVQVEKYFAFAAGQKDLHRHPITWGLGVETSIRGARLILSQDHKLKWPKPRLFLLC